MVVDLNPLFSKTFKNVSLNLNRHRSVLRYQASTDSSTVCPLNHDVSMIVLYTTMLNTCYFKLHNKLKKFSAKVYYPNLGFPL